jgi:transcription antitermination protein NusB
MQLLYSIDTTNDDKAFKNPISTLDKHFDKTRELFVYLVSNILAVAQYAEKDSRFKAAKYVPSDADLNINTKIAGNQILWQIVENATYQVAVELYKTPLYIEADVTRKLYDILTETIEYKRYIQLQSRDRKQDIEILNFIFNDLMLQSELFISHSEDKFANWDDDAEMLQSLINAYLSSPKNIEMHNMLDGDKWNFGKNLLMTCIDKKEHLLALVSPKLNNWDADRIASVDMILLFMGLSELLYFETIPTKVTINEYIDLAKEYSTVQSGQFINGLLDNLHKELLTEGKINKVQFKKK